VFSEDLSSSDKSEYADKEDILSEKEFYEISKTVPVKGAARKAPRVSRRQLSPNHLRFSKKRWS
jgi:hypothetical protein